ncbi:hypothetical protein FB45DRAFT_178647 [Roridomyces roridus]|uniref:Zn(2)-C6 fungal-type domain-containing protein n=1 Tax=Roridomyces roridus TaxID=1738132 RepID=A0AAD7FYI5_9AGAR|nr:hypothetical protein FB45DRAFT_178647 [Roridomyces roridus]
MASDHIDDIHADADDRFYAVFPNARPSPQQAEVEAAHARMFPPDAVYQFVDTSSWAFYPPTRTNFLPCSPSVASLATTASPISPGSESEYYDMGDTPPPSATSVSTNASFASHSPDSIYESPGADDTPPPSASSEPDLLLTLPDSLLAPAPPPERERPPKRRFEHYPASPPRSSILPVLPPGSLPHLPVLSGAQPLASASPPPHKKAKGVPRQRSGTGATDPTKKPPLACLFCRGRKIACGPPVGGAAQAGCNQCQRRALKCEYPLESRRGMRKKKQPASATPPPGEEEGKDKDGGEADVQVDKDVTGEGDEDAVKAEEFDLDGDIVVPVHVSTPLTVNVQLEKTRDPRRPPVPSSAH